jgi:putative transposase
MCNAVRCATNEDKERRISASRIAELVGRTARTVHRWKEKVKKGGMAALRPRSRRPLNPRQLPLEKRQMIVDLRLGQDEMGCERIAYEVGCSSSTVHKVLKQLDLVWETHSQRRFRSFERDHSNTLWQMDYTMIREGLWLFLAIDDHSRFIVCHRLMATLSVDETIAALGTAFSQYGVPEQILTDHGSQFYSIKNGVEGDMRFDRMCLENHIQHILAAVQHPQTCGKIENKNGRVKKALRRRECDWSRESTSVITSHMDDIIFELNFSRMHFYRLSFTLGDLTVVRKRLMIPYLRFVGHRKEIGLEQFRRSL